MKKDLVIFDCDGVLIDSEIIAHRAVIDELSRVGLTLNLERSVEIFSGVAEDDMLSVIEAEFGKIFSHNDLLRIVKKLENSMREELKQVINIDVLLNYLEESGIKRCVASNSKHKHVSSSLNMLKLSKYFKDEHMFSVEVVEKGKPEPDLFLYAANKLGVLPKDCVVIEDSIIGIKAAKAANMFVIGFLGASHTKGSWYYDRISEVEPDLIARDVRELIGIFDSGYRS